MSYNYTVITTSGKYTYTDTIKLLIHTHIVVISLKGVGGVSPAHSDSDGSSPLCQIRETSKRNVGSKRQTASTGDSYM